MRLPVLLCVLVSLCAAPGPVAGADRSCSDLRQFYTGKGFTSERVPQTEISGEFFFLFVFCSCFLNSLIVLVVTKRTTLNALHRNDKVKFLYHNFFKNFRSLQLLQHVVT